MEAAHGRVASQRDAGSDCEFMYQISGRAAARPLRRGYPPQASPGGASQNSRSSNSTSANGATVLETIIIR